MKSIEANDRTKLWGFLWSGHFYMNSVRMRLFNWQCGKILFIFLFIYKLQYKIYITCYVLCILKYIVFIHLFHIFIHKMLAIFPWNSTTSYYIQYFVIYIFWSGFTHRIAQVFCIHISLKKLNIIFPGLAYEYVLLLNRSIIFLPIF
jgi:hypothetical protein